MLTINRPLLVSSTPLFLALLSATLSKVELSAVPSGIPWGVWGQEKAWIRSL